MALPPLPAITSQVLLKQVFTHKSASVVQARLLKDKEELNNYERLAFLGDAILGASVAKYLFEHYPLHRIGPYTTQKSKLVSGAQLAEWAREYGLVSHLHCHADNRLSIENSTRVQASVFEAYLGAVYQEQGQDVVNEWIGQLIEPYIDLDAETEEYGWQSPMEMDAVDEAEGSEGSRSHVGGQKGALALLNEHFQKARGAQAPEWVEASTGPEHLPHWTVKVYDPTSRKLLATGTGRRKQGAKEQAAARALAVLSGASERQTKKRRLCLN